MALTISKDRLPKGFAYPSKTSIIEAQLAESGLALPVELGYHNDERFFFSAIYWIYEKRMEIHIGAVSLADRREATALVTETILPECFQWVDELYHLSPKSPMLFGKHDRLFFKREFPLQ